MKENRIPKKVLYLNLERTRLKGRPTNRWQDEVMEDRILVGGKGWEERVYNREEWKKLLTTAGNRRILHMTKERLNEYSTLGHFSSQGMFAITSTASAPPTPIQRHPRPPPFGVCESVPIMSRPGNA